MNINQIVTDLNTLKTCCKLVTKKKDKTEFHSTIETQGKKIGIFHAKEFDGLILKVFKAIPKIQNQFSLGNIRNRILTLLIVKLETATSFDSADLEDLVSSLNEIHEMEFECFAGLYGGQLDEDQLTLGDFTVYNITLSGKMILELHPNLVSHNDFWANTLVISVKVKCKDDDVAYQLARQKFEQFNLLAAFVIFDLSRGQRIACFDFKENSVSKIFAGVPDGGLGYHSSHTNLSNPFSIRKEYWLNSQLGHDRIWKMTSSSPKTEFELRILTAIEWIGKALLDQDPAKKFVQLVFAFETLLQFNEGGFISQGIASQLSDNIAFIIGRTVADRKETSRKMKKIYQTRSAIVHGGNTVIDAEELESSFNLARLLVLRFLTDEILNSFRSVADFINWTTDQKFQ